MADQRHAQHHGARVFRLADECDADLGLPGPQCLRRPARCPDIPHTIAVSYSSRQLLCSAAAAVPAAISCEQHLGDWLGRGDPSDCSSQRGHAISRSHTRRDNPRARPDTCSGSNSSPGRPSPTAASPYAHDRIPRICHARRRSPGSAITGTSSRREAPEGTNPDDRVRGIRDALLRYHSHPTGSDSTTSSRASCCHATCACAPRLSGESTAWIPDRL